MQFQLTVNVVALAIEFIGCIFTRISPFNAVQLLWINMIMDTFAALALATDIPTDDRLLKEQPHDKYEAIISMYMWRNIFGQSIY